MLLFIHSLKPLQSCQEDGEAADEALESGASAASPLVVSALAASKASERLAKRRLAAALACLRAAPLLDRQDEAGRSRITRAVTAACMGEAVSGGFSRGGGARPQCTCQALANFVPLSII